MAEYRVVMCNRQGLPYAELEKADVEEITWVLNHWGSMTFSFPTLYEKWAEVKLLTREVQVWRNGVLIWWGIPVRGKANMQRTSIQCVGLLWYYFRRFFGPVLTNYLTNPSFESDLTGWTAVGGTASVVTNKVMHKTKAAKLVSTSSADNYLYQRATVTANSDQPTFFNLAAWFHIDTAAATWTGPAFEERGLYIERRSSDGATLYETKFEPITNSVDRDKWNQIEVGVSVPTAATQRLEARLYSPHGAVLWDATSISVEESVASNPAGTDMVTMVERINTFAQDVAKGKSDLSIGFNGAVSGTLIHRAYQAFNADNIFEAIAEYSRLNLLDYDIGWTTDGRTRQLQTFTGRKGSYKPKHALELGRNIKQVNDYSVDGEQTASVTRVLGRGTGSDREIGYASDTSLLEGLVLESVDTAPFDITDLDQLQMWADEKLVQTKSLVRVPFLDCGDDAGDLITDLHTGDTVPIRIDYGWIQENATRRVMTKTLYPKTDRLKLGVT